MVAYFIVSALVPETPQAFLITQLQGQGVIFALLIWGLCFGPRDWSVLGRIFRSEVLVRCAPYTYAFFLLHSKIVTLLNIGRPRSQANEVFQPVLWQLTAARVWQISLALTLSCFMAFVGVVLVDNLVNLTSYVVDRLWTACAKRFEARAMPQEGQSPSGSATQEEGGQSCPSSEAPASDAEDASSAQEEEPSSVKGELSPMYRQYCCLQHHCCSRHVSPST